MRALRWKLCSSLWGMLASSRQMLTLSKLQLALRLLLGYKLYHTVTLLST